MKNREKGFVMSIIVIVFAIISVGASIYYFYSNDKAAQDFIFNDLVKSQGNKAPLTALEKAQIRAEQSRSLLDRLLAKYIGEQRAITSIQLEYSQMSDLLPSATATILKKRMSSGPRKQIVDLQKKMNDALAAWNAALAAAKAKNPTLSLAALIAEAQKNASAISGYAQELKTIIDNLTPENSGLTQEEIDALKRAAQKAIDDAKKQEEDIKKIEEAAKEEEEKYTPPVTPGVPTPTPAPIISQEDIDAAKEAAKKAEEDKKKEEEEVGIKQDVPLPTPTPTPDVYSGYDNNKNKSDPTYYDDIVRDNGVPEIEGSPSKNN